MHAVAQQDFNAMSAAGLRALGQHDRTLRD